MKEDDDMEDSGLSDIEDSAHLAGNSAGALDNTPDSLNHSPWRWRKKWRWDLEHLDHGLVRKLALALAVYGVVVMVVCLFMNIFFAASH